jgi:hypothetical protein
MNLALCLTVASLGVACGATPIDSDPGNGGVGGGNGSGGTPAPGATSIGPSTTTAVPGSGGTTGAVTSLPMSGSGGAAATSPTAGCAAGPVSWKTSTVSLQAAEFWIVADGKCYTSASAPVRVHSDPGWGSYTTLELVWTENGREMRYFIYFYADSSGWWSDEMRTYNGQQPYGDWLLYYGNFFRSPIGQSYVWDIDLTNDAQDAIRGELHLRGLTLSTTLTGS